MNIKRGDVYLAALDPVIGREISKTRPVVVISNDKNNAFSAAVTILPVTASDTQTVYPFEVFLPKSQANLPKNSKIRADQIRTLDKIRLVRRIGTLEKTCLDAMDQAVKIHLDLA